ncbi:hypothetical protein Plec18167_001963 [Paecilomyces lecythidis]|uniref:Uncharacterized protein n=1 Tax=Paecilomyces lecythidis TaxID=3004212 RepID=A0ABR3YAH8_9EURO
MEKTAGVEGTLAQLRSPSVAAFSTLQTLLPFRSTSRLADEALCLSSLVGVDPKHILSVPNDQESRMKIFWTTVEKIPPEVLFWIGPKLQTKGFRWAPKTFMNAREWSNLNGSYNEFGATLTEDGLRVHLAAWMLGCSRGRPIKAQFVMVDTHKTVYTVSCLDGNTGEFLDPDNSFNPWLQVGWTEATNYPGALYVLSRLDVDAQDRLAPRISYDAILVLAYQKSFVSNTDHIYARYICPVRVRKHGTEVGWTRNYTDWIETMQSRGDIDPEIGRLGLWSSGQNTEPGVTDLVGCSAVSKGQPWVID